MCFRYVAVDTVIELSVFLCSVQYALDNKLTITYITVYASEFKAEKSKVTLLLAKQTS